MEKAFFYYKNNRELETIAHLNKLRIDTYLVIMFGGVFDAQYGKIPTVNCC